ncbi:hypothetical protein KIH27_01670 [Mycobacterium sp. M1]|uniref:Uncharacterized protein n=1 Tax=Mycolicibacter acidiphilus TaxID=2835306 RepID=A0ABS5RDD1_9MYCO|nr:hypothetical protein [Mycolicibacter acidiphilus]
MISASIGLVRDRAAEHHGVGEQRDCGIHVTSLDSLTELVHQIFSSLVGMHMRHGVPTNSSQSADGGMVSTTVTTTPVERRILRSLQRLRQPTGPTY